MNLIADIWVIAVFAVLTELVILTVCYRLMVRVLDDSRRAGIDAVVAAERAERAAQQAVGAAQSCELAQIETEDLVDEADAIASDIAQVIDDGAEPDDGDDNEGDEWKDGGETDDVPEF